jgi:hypothetical protein
MVKIEEYLMYQSIMKILRDHGRPFRTSAYFLLIEIQKYSKFLSLRFCNSINNVQNLYMTDSTNKGK